MTLALLRLVLLMERWQESEQKLTHMQHQKVSWVLECHAGYKNAVNLGHIRPSNPLLGGSASFEQGRGICVPEAHRDAWVSRRCIRFLLLFSQFYSAKAQFQPSPGPPVFTVGRGQEDF